MEVKFKSRDVVQWNKIVSGSTYTDVKEPGSMFIGLFTPAVINRHRAERRLTDPLLANLASGFIYTGEECRQFELVPIKARVVEL